MLTSYVIRIIWHQYIVAMVIIMQPQELKLFMYRANDRKQDIISTVEMSASS